MPEKAHTLLCKGSLPDNLKFHQTDENGPLPFNHGYFDAAYSWSVFEHVKNVSGALESIFGVLKSGGVLFIQIAPLYYSAYGSHLGRLGIKGWEHLIFTDEELATNLKNRKLKIRKREQDILYEKSDSEAFWKYLFNEYRSLNKKTVKELVAYCEAVGYSIENLYLSHEYWLRPDKKLLEKYDRQELMNKELWLVLRKPNNL